MKYEDIKDFNQRCEEHPAHQTGMIGEHMIQARLSEEIDELRAYIEAKQEQDKPVAWFWFDERDGGEWIHIADNQIDANKFGDVKIVPLYTHPQRQRVVFPTMLRQMWSGGEVQAWLDENVNKE